jgi:hypothetical protein
MGASPGITRVFQIAAQPWVVQATDATNDHFLRTLGGVDGDARSDLVSKVETQALWAIHVPNTGSDLSGSCYVVSSEAYKRLKAGRLT